MSKGSERCVVVGSGVIGLCCACALVRRGHEVVVLEREGEGGDNCSRENAGMVVPSHFRPLAAPGVVGQGLKWLRDPESPFYVRPRLSVELLRWGLLFLRHATSAHVARCERLLRDLHLESRRLFVELAEEEDFGLQQRGLLMLCETERFLEEETKLAERARELGLRVEVCRPQRLAELDPGIEMRAVGGVWYEDDCHMDPGRFLAMLRERFAAAGGETRHGCEVAAIEDGAAVLRDGTTVRGDHIVVAGGAWTPKLAKTLGLRLPMQAGKGYSLTLRDPAIHPRLCSVLGEARVAVTPMGSSLRVAGTMEIGGNNLAITERRVQGIIKSACRGFPGLSPGDFEGVRRWAGLRPVTPDGLPYLGRVPGRANVLVASGHAMLGLSLGPVTGKLVAEAVEGGTLPEQLRVERFG